MRLNDPLITSFDFEGKKYSIDLAFDNVLDVFDVLKDDSLLDYEKIEICLELLIGKKINGFEAIKLWSYVFEEFIVFKRKPKVIYDLKGNPIPIKETEEEEEVLDLDQDAEYIYASFVQAYGIDLIEQQGKLHWHSFKALLNGLPNDTIMQRVIEIRMWKPQKGDTVEYKETMKNLQAEYALERKPEAP